MSKIILPILIGLTPILILWLSGNDLSRSKELATAAGISFILAIGTFLILMIAEMESKK